MNINSPFEPSSRMADVIHRDYRLMPIIGRFGIELGFGNKTVHEVCSQKGINEWFFLEIINSYHDKNYFPEKKLQEFSASMIVDYLVNTHRYYLETKVPEIQEYINAMEEKASKESLENIQLLNEFFGGYRTELEKHLDNEDNHVFPYIISLETSVNDGNCSPGLIEKIRKEPIEDYERNHDNLETKLGDLKNLIIKFLPPVLCKLLCQKLLTELFRLEADLENHGLIEDRVLVPKVKILEERAEEMYKAG